MMPKPDRKKVVVDMPTYVTLREFSRINGLKPRSVLATLINIILADDILSAEVIDLTKQKELDETR